MSREVRVEIEICEGSTRVWDILTDFERYPKWNPFIRSVQGSLKPGARIKICFRLHNGRKRCLRPTLTTVDPQRELRWVGHFLVPGLLDGEHIFLLGPSAGNKTRFIQHERFSGILTPLFWRNLEKDAEYGFREMNEALKHFLETSGNVEDQKVRGGNADCA